jgi:hypothetical protein
MPRVHVQRVVKSAAKIKRGWSPRPTFALGELTFDRFNAAHAEVVEIDQLIAAKRHELRALLISRTRKTRVLQSFTTRALSGFRGSFGPDSMEYGEVGGTRQSKHRPKGRKKRA